MRLKIELNSQGIQEVLKSTAIQNNLSEISRDICKRCGEGYKTDIYVGKVRANASVIADTWGAKRDNLKNNTMLKSLRG